MLGQETWMIELHVSSFWMLNVEWQKFERGTICGKHIKVKYVMMQKFLKNRTKCYNATIIDD